MEHVIFQRLISPFRSFVTSRRIWPALLVSLATIASGGYGEPTTNIIVTAATPEPNYGLSTDSGDLQQFTDGTVVTFPTWSNQQSITWAHRTPVQLTAHLSGSKSRLSTPGIISIHTSRGTYAEVQPPRQIDVYSKISDASYSHVGSGIYNKDDFPDNGSFWLNVAVTLKSPDLVIVIHADGKYLTIDEIKWTPAAIGDPPSDNNLLVSDALSDSTARLIDRLQSLALKPAEFIDKWAHSLGGNTPTVWATSCWDVTSRYPAADEIRSLQKNKPTVSGYAGENEPICVGIANTRDSIMNLNVSLSPSTTAAVALAGRLEPILAANGNEVFDPILPIDLNQTITLPPRRATYLWFSLNLKAIGVGSNSIDISINETGKEPPTLLSIPLDIVDFPDTARIDFFENTWAYTTDLPIWNRPQIAVQDLTSHGVNVFTIPPTHIPRLTTTKTWDDAREQLLISDLELFRGRGLILLYTGWEQGLNKQLFDSGSTEESPTEKQYLQSWLDHLKGVIAGTKIKNTDWALYPVDEPSGDKIHLLLKIAKRVHAIDRNIRIFANPTSFSGSRTSQRDLADLNKYISIWQPHLSLVRAINPTFFTSLKKPWWIYAGPTAPPKATDPIMYYRLLAWQAWELGAGGVGMWSYSDTGSWAYRGLRLSSAWNDFDGYFPDYAMVYESPTGPITSRRWEAFREGAEDYRLFKAYELRLPRNKEREIARLKERIELLLNTKNINEQANRFRNDILTKISELSLSH